MLQVRFLGQFDVRADGKRVVIPSRAGQSLFAFLLLTAGTRHRREKLAGQFWPDTLEESARGNLRRELWRVRKALADQGSSAAETLLAEEMTISFNVESEYWLDVAQLERNITSEDSLNERVNQVSLYRGELLPGFYEDWVVLERERVQALFEGRLQELLQSLIADQRWAAVLEWGEHWIAHGQTPEPAYRALMLAYAARGDRAKVAGTFERCVQALQQELGVEPSGETRELYEGLLAGRTISGVDLAANQVAQPPKRMGDEPPVPGEPPFKGLQYFDENDASLFFGREVLTAKLVERLRESQFLAVVVGASGSGKSSALRAGLVPALKNHASPAKEGVTSAGDVIPIDGAWDWQVHILTPTAHPLEALATSLTQEASTIVTTVALLDDLARDPRSLHLYLRRWQMANGKSEAGSRRSTSTIRHMLLVVDQFEELFTLCRDEFEREAFIDNLLTAAQPDSGGQLTLVLAIRADFYAHLAQYPELREAVARNQEYIGPMSAEELRRAIEEPARGKGWEFESGLVDLILRDVGSEPGALPLLSHAMLETWKRRSGRTLTFKGYQQSGGVQGAIAQTAETVYLRLTPEQQSLARSIFLRLTELGEGTEDTRRRASLVELLSQSGDAEEVRALLNILAEARLITLGQGVAEVAHEALIREWPTLREWLNQDREGLRLHRHLTEAAHEWELLERDPGALYRGARLAQAREWTALNPNALNAREDVFLESSLELEESEAAEREKQRQRELEGARELAETQARAAAQLRRRAFYLRLALIVALVMAGAALVFGQQAQSNATAAEKEGRSAFSRELAAEAIGNLDVDPQLSLLLALHAINVTFSIDKAGTTEAENALHRAVLAARLPLTLTGQKGAVLDAAFSPDGKRVVTSSSDGTISVWAVFSGKQLLTQATRLLVTRGSDPLLSESIHTVFSTDGLQLTTLDEDESGTAAVELLDAATGQVSRTAKLSIPADQVKGDAISADGTRIATTQFDGTVRVWNAATGQLLLTLSGRSSDNIASAFSRDGTRFAFGGSDNLIHVWDLAAGRELDILNANIEAAYPAPNGDYFGITSIVFSPDGSSLAGAFVDGTVRIWEVAGGRELVSLCCGTGRPTTVAFSPGATRIATGSAYGNVTIWDAVEGKELFALVGNTHSVNAVAFSPDGGRLATVGDSSLALIWDLLPNTELERVSTGPIFAFALSPDGKRFATSHPDNTVQVRNMESGRLLQTLSGHTARVTRIAFSRDGTRLATASSDLTARVWDLATGSALFTLAGHTKGVNGVAFSPDGNRLATASSDHTAKVWDLRSGKEQLTLGGSSDSVRNVAFSPDGTRLAGATADGWMEVWDLDGKLVISDRIHSDSVEDVQFSPDGKRLVTASQDGTGRVMDAITGRGLFYLFVQTNPLSRAVFSPDSSKIATASGDGTTRVWDASTGRELLNLHGHTLGVNGVAFSPDGRQLITSGEDGVVLSYVMPLQDLIGLARSRLTRSWTAAECRTFLHLEQCPSTP